MITLQKIMMLFLCVTHVAYGSDQSIKKEKKLVKNLTTLIKKAKKADSYWAHVQHAPWRNAVTNLITLGVRKSWKDTIATKRTKLQKTIVNAATVLGELQVAECSESAVARAHRLLKKEKKMLAVHKIPHHFERQWPKYFIAGVSAASLYYIFTQKITVDEIKNKACQLTEKLHEPIDDLKKFPAKIKSLQDQIVTNEKMYQRDLVPFINEISNDPELVALMERSNIDLKVLVAPHSNLSDIQKVIDQIKSSVISYNISKASVLVSVPQDAQNYDVSNEAKLVRKGLDETAKKVKELNKALKAVTSQTKNPNLAIKTFLDALDALVGKEDLDVLLADFKTTVHNVAEFTTAFNLLLQNNHQSTDQALNNVGPLIVLSRQLIEGLKSSSLKVIAQCILFELQYFKIMVLDGMYKSQLPIILVGAIPAALLCYGTYKGITKTYHAFTDMHSIEPLKQDLIQFELHLNRHRHTKQEQLSYFYHGMSRYWITQLQRYHIFMSSRDYALYEQSIEELGQVDLSPEQKMMIIESMFKQYEFLK